MSGNKEDYIVTGDTPYNNGKDEKKYFKAGDKVNAGIGKTLAKFGKAGPASDEATKAKAERFKGRKKRLAKRVAGEHKAMGKIGNGPVANTSAEEGAKRA